MDEDALILMNIYKRILLCYEILVIEVKKTQLYCFDIAHPHPSPPAPPSPTWRRLIGSSLSFSRLDSSGAASLGE